MCRSVAGLLSLAVLALWVTSGSCIGDCSCSEIIHCRPLSARTRHPVQLFAFHSAGKDWKHYDWSKITTVVTSGVYDAELLCHAHAHNVRVVMEEKIRKNDSFIKKSWIDNRLHMIQQRNLDGVHLRFASALDATFSAKLPSLVEEIKTRFMQRIAGSQISFYVPWICNTSTTVCSDLVSASKYADYVHVTSFDVQNHMWTDCFAKANAPYHQTLTGISSYIKKGINSEKIILIVPWFGYDYTCYRFIEAGRCELEEIAIEGPACSELVRPRIPYKEIMELLPKSMSGRVWDDDLKAPFFVYKKGKVFHEVWYDDPESISLRTTFLKKLKLGGIGMLNANYANYSSDPIAAMKTEEMWNALCPP